MSSVEIILTVLGAAGGTGVIIAGLSAWLGKVWADRIAQAQKLSGEIDLDLRKRRIDVYTELWEATAVLPKWPRAQDVTYEALLALSQTLKTWYFRRGGMYLSRTTHRDAYSPLQDTLADILKTNSAGPVSAEHYDLVRERCSALRTALASDIESRRESPI
jgi:hypothetical protein